MDKRLGSYLSIYQAKNYKKLLMAITRSRVLQKIEIDTLFNKANHFLDKKSFEKEKEYVKKEIKHKYIAEGEFGRSYADKKFLKNGGD